MSVESNKSLVEKSQKEEQLQTKEIDKTKSVAGLTTDQENELNEKKLEQLDKTLINTWNKTTQYYKGLTIYNKNTNTSENIDEFWETEDKTVAQFLYSSKKVKRGGAGLGLAAAAGTVLTGAAFYKSYNSHKEVKQFNETYLNLDFHFFT